MCPRIGRWARVRGPYVQARYLNSDCACEEPRERCIPVLLDEQFVRGGDPQVSFAERSDSVCTAGGKSGHNAG
jgi:hypothetical protein